MVETPLAQGQSFTELNIQAVKRKQFKNKMPYSKPMKRNMVGFQNIIKRNMPDLLIHLFFIFKR